MCGIAGFTGDLRNNDLLTDMVNLLTHRGPDDSGFWSAKGISLGMRRLSIIDPQTGGQPVFNKDKTITVVFNGEIYNHKQLREELQVKGYNFQSDHSDSEVLVYLYEEYGLEMFTYLNGMFAIGIWDSKLKHLVLVRDHVGIKPIYYSLSKSGISFASEPKSLLLHPEVSKAPDFEGLDHYFTFKNVPAPRSAFKDIKQLQPGQYLLWEASKSSYQIKNWYELPNYSSRKALKSESDAVLDLRQLLESSVEMQMQSDVPLGAYLSGGLDSSLVVALMASKANRPIDTFTLVYEGGSIGKQSDQDFAREVSKIYGTNHHEKLVRAEDIPEAIDAVVNAFDEPFSGVISTWFLSGLIKEHVTVALSGDGADELFGSYRTQRLAAPIEACTEAESGNISRSKAVSICEMHGFTYDEVKIIYGKGDAAAQRMAQYIMDDPTKRMLYTSEMLEKIDAYHSENLVRRQHDKISDKNYLNMALTYDFQTLLPDQVLAFVDRLSMSHSVEVRPPFLDPRIIEFVMKLPDNMKIRNGRTKHILKEVASGLLPDSLIDRPKEGFLMPVNEWILSNLGAFVKDTLSPHRLKMHNLLDSDSVQQLLNGKFDEGIRSGDRIWNLVMFQLWWEKHIG